MACVESGLPVVRGKKAISLERQVRIAAGLLVLLGALLGWFVHPGFYLFTAFVGLNLLQSAFTRWCPMMAILRRAGLQE